MEGQLVTGRSIPNRSKQTHLLIMSKFVLVFAVFSVLAFASTTAAKNCQTLNGTWYNQRGGKLYLEHKRDNRIVGEYWTNDPRLNTSKVAKSILLGGYVRFFFH